MEGEEAPAAGPAFHANKRRKVFRKRTDLKDHEAADERLPQPRTTGEGDGSQDDATATAKQSHVNQLRKPRKHGIRFSSTTANSPQDAQKNEETAMILAEPLVPQPAERENDRFVRPTGKAVVTDNRHMSAFVDSKLAEMRSVTFESTHDTPVFHDNTAGDVPGRMPSLGGKTAVPMSASTPESAGSTKPTAAIKSNSSQRPRHRRQPVRTEADIARDGLIDQIMKESQVPVYDQAATPRSQPTSGAGGEVDNDAAAAAAFRAEFLAAAEQRNLQRRPPAPPPAGTTSGPKLGGSRAQRERMKAIEEAKGKGK